MAVLGNVIIETAGTEEEAAEGIEDALTMDIEEAGKNNGEGEEGGEGIQKSLGALEFLTQEAETTGTTLVDACNGFSEPSRMEMLWTVRYCWLAGRGSHSIAICIGRNFYSASQGSHQSQS